jgi:hypothetical protein
MVRSEGVQGQVARLVRLSSAAILLAELPPPRVPWESKARKERIYYKKKENTGCKYDKC